MTPKRYQQIVRGEISQLRREELIEADTYDLLMREYPTSTWDFSSLSRWFLIFGAIAVACGLGILGKALFVFTLTKLAIFLAVLVAACFYGGRVLIRRDLVWASRAIELLGGLTLIGLTFTLGVIFSSGSGNWPALLLIDMVILLALSYLLRNVLLLILTSIVFFAWFGGVTGYVSGWGAYWFGMNYPLRFLLAGLAMTGVALLHRNAEQERLRSFDGFFKVWLSAGVFFSEMSLWLMSLFGNYGEIFSFRRAPDWEYLVFNLLWAGFNIALLILGSRYQLRMLRGYATTFLIIQAYTLYFWKVAGHLGPVLGTFVAGVATVGVVVFFEQKRRQAKRAEPPSQQST